MDRQLHFHELERRAARQAEALRLAKQTVLLLLAVAAFLIYYLLEKLEQALAIGS